MNKIQSALRINDYPVHMQDTSLSQREMIISNLEAEIQHFKSAMVAIQDLPSSQDEGMNEAYEAYCKMISAYKEMISVRFSIIERLKHNS